MKTFGLLTFLLTGILVGNAPVEVKLRDIAKPNTKILGLKIVGACAGSLSALRALLFLYWNRDKHGDLHDNNLVVHGPDSVFLYAATKYPGLQPLLPKIFNYYTESTSNLNEKELNHFLTLKEQVDNVVLTYGDDIDVPLRLKALLEQKGWPNEKIDAFLSDITIKVHNSREVMEYFRDYSPESTAFYLMLDKKVRPEKYVPEGYKWKFEHVEK